MSHQAAVADGVLRNGERVSLNPAWRRHEATLAAPRSGGSHAAEAGRGGSWSDGAEGPGPRRTPPVDPSLEAGATSQELEPTYRSVNELLVLLSCCRSEPSAALIKQKLSS